jgi:hypothetical protein
MPDSELRLRRSGARPDLSEILWHLRVEMIRGLTPHKGLELPDPIAVGLEGCLSRVGKPSFAAPIEGRGFVKLLLCVNNSFHSEPKLLSSRFWGANSTNQR